MADRRVAITGLGMVSAAGIGHEDTWQTLLAGESRLSEIALFDASRFPSRVAGNIEDFSAKRYVPKSYRKSVKVMARDIELAVAAADLAFRDAKVTTRGVDADAVDVEPKRLGCNIGAGLICADLDELGYAVNAAAENGQFHLTAWGTEGLANLTPLWLLKYLPNMLSCHVTIIHGAEGPSNCITCGDASGPLAAAESAGWIATGRADLAVVGGAESKVNPMGMLRQTLLGRLNTTGNDQPSSACRPFDVGHAGTVAGEGGALLILEDLERAEARGATIYAEIVGYGAACEPAGMDIKQANAGGLDAAVAQALGGAGIAADQVDLICAHGTGVPDEDRAESNSWHRALGERAGEIPAVAVTGSVGSLFAGGGAFELASAVLALHHQAVPPTANFSSLADGCRLNLADQARQGPLTHAVTGSFTVGGQSGAVVLRRYPGGSS
jgi:3-oxoacyl-[acyl-carrier-protein] synthase II